MSGNFEGHDVSGLPEGSRHAGDDFWVVGLGASAGGIKALKDFFAHVPRDSGMAYVVILHLSPEHESHLAEVLQLATEMPITQVRGSVRIEPNHAYVIPPNKSLAMNDGHLTLSEVKRIEERRAPVDIFFRTLAESKHARAVSVVLSGTGSDGSMGMKRVKEMGGVCVVQDPREAEYSDMPRHSIATGLVDYVLPVSEIPQKLIAYKEGAARTRIPVEPLERAETDEQALRQIFTQLRVRTGHDFTNYKRATVLRRIERRLNVNELSDLQAYAGFIRARPDEAHALLKDLLISVTNFFRDGEAFEALERGFIRRLFEGKAAGEQVRVWVAGCATGEEAYTMAMMLAEFTENVVGAPTAQVFATDIDEQAISTARAGLYTNADVADISPERLRRFFIKEPNGYRVRRELREMVLFAHHNLIKDPPFLHLDLVSCRNLLIYFNRTAQERVMQVFHFALNPGGFMFLGSSESVDGSTDLFMTVDKEAHIYQSRAVAARLPLPVNDHAVTRRVAEQRHKDESLQETRAIERLSYADLHQRLVEQYVPPSVVVNEEYDIVHLSERAGRYMQVAGGEPSHNLLKMVRPEIRMELRTALYQAVQKRASVEARGVAVPFEDRTRLVNLLVRPVFSEGDSARGFILVVFEDAGEGAESAGEGAAEAIIAAEPAARQLEDELVRVKAQLRATVEQYETQAEEMKASNEELQAMNEELRSTAEELETSKEELQSVNEELTTVNQELKIKIEELSQANNDFRNLMNSTDIGTIFLDRALRLKLFTPRARDVFNLIPADVGRPLSDITAHLADADLLADLERVLTSLQPVQREVKTHEGRWHLMNILPYRTTEDRIEGVIVTFLDITARKEAEGHLRESEERLRLLIESVTDYSIIIQSVEGIIEVWNPGAERMFGFTKAEAIGQPIEIIFTPEDRARGAHLEEMKRALEAGHAADERWHLRKDGSRFYVSGVLTLLRDGKLSGYAKIARDLTESKRTEEALRRAHEELERRVAERTRELAEANEALRSENVERRRIEKARLQLLRQLVRVQDDERRRIARDIHDHLGQQSTALRLKLESLKTLCLQHEELCEPVAQTQEIAARLDADVDFLAWELRPAALDDLGLAPALANFVKEWSKHYGITADSHTTGMDDERPSPEVEINLYRIAQEALNNTYKHAQASRVDVLLERRDHSVVLIIEDNGIGFDPNDNAEGDRGLGLLGMRERAALVGGTLEIEATPNQGTTIFARVPLLFAEEGVVGG
ncbi:MAG: two-component system, chemotaxis family, CheB/CheR fusion protein [Blastocatellia bacterium]|jgi:two-component system CheB/CheR fusion protein|nr:two-component system, chemotaxis family, CheB/CheR fusion protein [Blastocatellia bacterium]